MCENSRQRVIHISTAAVIFLLLQVALREGWTLAGTFVDEAGPSNPEYERMWRGIKERDINLVAVAEAYEQRTGERVEWHHRGAQVLFETWPFRKMRGGGGAKNIGAIRLPTDRPLEAADLGDAIDHPWETEVPPGETARLLESPGTRDPGSS